ncbi:flagellar hook-associated protein FlgK [Pukyongiella litopenaei]|uniref:Flagellar hook-associated protein 1 n=1 Tax=Pukyongiella litopenaei TaxID=2605946 RepID=A0A2S0MSH5_9RHOB|nr:flagellar hook-associated protein FlgK [Pukyongiella litopenaei]AVO38840.1 flagellar hook-associated protein FlgK [Pukyongiella litopenaei]
MALTSALNSALSGLNAASRASVLVSENLANAMTEGYGRRTLGLGSNGDVAPGVRVIGVTRNTDPSLVASRRGADADLGAAAALSRFHARVLDLVGNSDEPGSISSRLAEFESSLIEAASRPDSAVRLDAAAQAGVDLARAISDASRGIQDMRIEADRGIGDQVERLNAALQEVRTLNARISAAGAGTGEQAALADQRQVIVDEINEMIPVRIVERDRGQVALFTQGGATLLDGMAAELSFEVTNLIVPEMQVGGALSGLELNGRPITPSAVGGGTLAARFAVRDDLAVEAQAELDSLARDLVERFEDPALDATRIAGSPGLFTDDGNALDPGAATGLAGRLSFNALADPERGGASWLLRDGLGAATPGDQGNARLLQSLGAALSADRTLTGSPFGTGAMSALDASSALLSQVARRDGIAARTLSFATASQTELLRAEQAQGVDTDAELQSLMMIERIYAANAKMIETVDDMLQTLLRI